MNIFIMKEKIVNFEVEGVFGGNFLVKKGITRIVYIQVHFTNKNVRDKCKKSENSQEIRSKHESKK